MDSYLNFIDRNDSKSSDLFTNGHHLCISKIALHYVLDTVGPVLSILCQVSEYCKYLVRSAVSARLAIGCNKSVGTNDIRFKSHNGTQLLTADFSGGKEKTSENTKFN